MIQNKRELLTQLNSFEAELENLRDMMDPEQMAKYLMFCEQVSYPVNPHNLIIAEVQVYIQHFQLVGNQKEGFTYHS